MRSGSLTALAVAVAMTGLAACSSSHATAGRSPDTVPAAGRTNAPAASGPARSSAPARSAAQTGSTPPRAGSPASASAHPSGAPTAPSASPSHDWTATEAEIPIDAAVTPSCVVVGSTARLDVKTKPKGAVGFVAVYAGEKSGAAPPFGEGYGGNDKGTADGSGKWSSSWTVALNTPPGPAYVLLVVAYSGKQRQIKVPFTVAKGACGT
jgi:hypothetical protein